MSNEVTILTKCPMLYCYGNNLGLSYGDHNDEVVVLLR